VTQPPPQDPEPTLGRLAGSLGALTQQVADLRRKLDTQGRRLDTAGVDHLAVALAELSGRFEELAQTVTEALDAAAPGGPAAPRWDNMAAGDRARELTRLQNWVTKILVPHYCASGGYTMPPCWAEHTPALWELGTLAAHWRRIYDRPRPNLGLALEFYDRWLPNTMRRLADMTRNCTPVHRPNAGLHWPHGHHRAPGQEPRRRVPRPRLHGRRRAGRHPHHQAERRAGRGRGRA
jgi:hypothetical protein